MKSVVFAVVLALATPALHAADFGNVVFIGDSITEGTNSPTSGVTADGYSWRYPFWKQLVDHGDTFTFVGSRSSNKNGSIDYPNYTPLTGPNAGNPMSFDGPALDLDRHESIWGTNTTERLNTLNSTSLGHNHWVDLNYDGTFKTARTAFIFMGGNDLSTSNPDAATLAGVSDRIGSMVTQLQAANANVSIYLISILPRFSGSTPDGHNGDYATINGVLSGFATSKDTATSDVRYVDAYSLMAADKFYDGVHPNVAGQQIVATAVYQATAVPEPASLLFLTLGGGIFCCRRRRA